MKTAASPATSAGARLERKAVRAYLRRLIRRWDGHAGGTIAAEETLAWVLKRQGRYDRRPGGLGR